MKVFELLSKLDFSKKEPYYVNDDFLNEFGENKTNFDIDKIELQQIRIATWCCTDSFVGSSVICYNDIPLCISFQPGRKSDQTFRWISKGSFQIAKQLIENARILQNDDFKPIDLNEEIGESYRLEFAGQRISQLHNIAFFDGKKVCVSAIESKNYVEERVKITFDDGREDIVNINKLEFPFLGLKVGYKKDADK